MFTVFLFTFCEIKQWQTSLKSIESDFITPSDSLQTSVYWYWISDIIPKEGVVNDLYAMKNAGINWAFIGDLNLPKEQRQTWCPMNSYKADSPLQPSGLFGPVIILNLKL